MTPRTLPHATGTGESAEAADELAATATPTPSPDAIEEVGDVEAVDDVAATATPTPSADAVEAVDEVRTLGMGAPIAPRTTPTLFLYGRANGDDEIGLYRSTDDGATFEMIAEHPGGSFDSVTVVEGDASIPGRVYIGFAGSGSAVGDDLALASTDQS